MARVLFLVFKLLDGKCEELRLVLEQGAAVGLVVARTLALTDKRKRS